MTWLDRLNNVELEIITGDEQVYKPLWQESEKNIQYNTEAFDFIGVNGTYVERKEQKGNQFPINFIFEGEDCIDVAEAFEISAMDKRPWTIKHPFYGELLVQPLSLKITTTVYNIARVTGTVWETITTKFPEDEVLPGKTVETLKTENDVQVSTSFQANVPNPDVGLVNPALNAITKISQAYAKISQIKEDIQLLKDLARTASGAAQNMLNNVDRFINSTIALINFPFQIIQTIESKITNIKDSIDDLFEIFNQDDNQEQFLYEALSTASLSQLALVSVNPTTGASIAVGSSTEITTTTEIEDYTTRTEVAETFDLINTTYDSVLTNFDDNEFIQDSTLALQLDIIINFSMANLYEIAFEAKQERTILIDKDDNIINLAHRFFGPGDKSLQTFIDQNQITRDEYLKVKKGRDIIWYV